jgi:hypothetical protein
LEQELTVTKDHLQATNEAMEEMRIQMEEMRVEIEKLRTDVQRYNYNNTELSVRLAKKDEFFFELDDRLLDVEGDLEYVFKRIKTRKRVVIEDQQPVAADQPASEECEAAGAPGSEVTAPMAGQIPAQGSTAAEAPDVTAPMTDQTSAHECEAAEAPEVTAPLSDQTLAPIEDRGLPLDSGSISLEDNVTTTPNTSGQINPTALTTAPDGVDEEQVGPSSTDAMAPATVDASGLISDKPSNNTAMPPPPAPVITLEPATPETSQERNATGVSLLAVPKKPADLSRPRSTSRSRSPATASGEPRRSPRGLTPAPLSSQGTSSKRPGDAPENEPPAKKSKADR